MPTTSIDLGNHFTSFKADLKETGRYRNASEVVRAGLRLLEEQEAEYQTRLDNLRQMLLEGEQSGENDSILDDIFAEVKAEINGKYL